MDSVSRYGSLDFAIEYGLDWDLLVTDCRFLCLSFPPSSLLNDRLRPLVQICCLVYALVVSRPKINIFDYTTYPDLSVRIEQDLLFLVLSRFAPEWLLGSKRFTNRLHTNLEIEVPKTVVDTFSAGLKYISPIAIKKSIVKASWYEFCTQALRSWDNRTWEQVEKSKDSDDPFYSLPIPFKLSGWAKPYEGKPNEDAWRILQAGWRELNSLLSNVPNLDRNGRSVEVESKDALQWCFDNDILVKPTDKNLGTALVSAAWYESKVSDFILKNKGYALISEEEARTVVTQTVAGIRGLCESSTTHNFTSGDLSKFLSSRLPPPRVVVDPCTGDEVTLPDDLESTIVSLPVFNGLPKIHKTPWGIRPVIPCHSVVQGPVSEFLSKILKTLLADHPQILTSRDFIQMCPSKIVPLS